MGLEVCGITWQAYVVREIYRAPFALVCVTGEEGGCRHDHELCQGSTRAANCVRQAERDIILVLELFLRYSSTYI
jgi:hypothetical protein